MGERFFKKIKVRVELMVTERMANDNFAVVLKRYMKEEHVKVTEFTQYVGINKSTLTRYRNGNVIPTKKVLMRICIALHLYRERSDYLFELCGYVLGNTNLHYLYKAILADVFLNRRTINDYTEFLKENGVDENDLL